MARRPDRPASCPLDASEDVCIGCPNRIPPCSGVADRGECPTVQALAAALAEYSAEVQRGAKPRGSLEDSIRATRAALGPRPPGAI